MNKESKKTRTTCEEERLNEGGREFGHIHEPSQAQEASGRRGLADDVMPNTRRQQAQGRAQEGVTGSHRGSGTRQSRPPGGAQHRKTRQSERKAA